MFAAILCCSRRDMESLSLDVYQSIQRECALNLNTVNAASAQDQPSALTQGSEVQRQGGGGGGGSAPDVPSDTQGSKVQSQGGGGSERVQEAAYIAKCVVDQIVDTATASTTSSPAKFSSVHGHDAIELINKM